LKVRTRECSCPPVSSTGTGYTSGSGSTGYTSGSDGTDHKSGSTGYTSGSGSTGYTSGSGGTGYSSGSGSTGYTSGSDGTDHKSGYSSGSSGTGHSSGSSGGTGGYQFSQECGGYTKESQSCDCVRPLNREAWKSQTWPDNTRTRKFKCLSTTWWQILNKIGTLSAYESLAVEYISAILNIMNGVVPPTVVQNAIDDSEDLLDKCNWSHYTTYQASKQQTVLNGFNNGNPKYVSLLDTTDEVFAMNDVTSTATEHSSSFLLILIPSIMVIAVIGIVVILVFIKKRYTLIINTE
jgi:hypothetical protein